MTLFGCAFCLATTAGFACCSGVPTIESGMDYSASADLPSGPAMRPRLTLSGILLYERVDRISGWVLVAMLIFSPWAFGTTQNWSIWVMNVCGYLVGLLLAIKLFIRYRLGHRPVRWGQVSGDCKTPLHWVPLALGITVFTLLIYCAVSALNARADYDPIRLTIKYRDYLKWLPHSYDRMATWDVFFQLLAWSGSFWALRDWLLGMTPEESRVAKSGQYVSGSLSVVPSRLGALLWILVVNGTLLGIEGIIQRLEGSGNLLFLVKPRVNPGADAQFGPFAYRSNAAQYLNLIWPVALGFWWWLQRTSAKHSRRWSRHWLLVCATVMAACPIISTSRAGALTGFALLMVAVGVLISGKRTDGLAKLAVLGVFGLAIAGGAWLGWQSLNPRLNELGAGYRERELMYKTARIIADENPVFGTGPGTFEHVFQLYRQSLDEYWPKQLHNDWLELLLTFGWIGFAMILAALALVIAHGFRTQGIPASQRFVWLVWLALAGCLLQARWDFPFRVYSVVFLFLALCAVLTTLAKASRAR